MYQKVMLTLVFLCIGSLCNQIQASRLNVNQFNVWEANLGVARAMGSHLLGGEAPKSIASGGKPPRAKDVHNVYYGRKWPADVVVTNLFLSPSGSLTTFNGHAATEKDLLEFGEKRKDDKTDAHIALTVSIPRKTSTRVLADSITLIHKAISKNSILHLYIIIPDNDD